MEDYAGSLAEFEERFASEAAWLEYLASLRWPGGFVCPKCGANQAWLTKRWLLGTYQGAVRPSHLGYYLDEFTFRFNRRTSRQRGKLFYRLVQQALMVDPVPEKELKAEMPAEENFDDLEL